MSGTQELEKLVVRLVGEGTSFERMLDNAVKDTKEAVHEIEKATKEALEVQRTLDEAAQIINAVKTPTERYTETVDRLAQMHKAGHLPQQMYYRALKEAGQALPHVREAQEAYARAVERGKEVTKAARTPTERYKEAVAELNQLQRAGHITAETHARSINHLNREFSQGLHAIRAYGTHIQQVGSGLRNAGMSARMTGQMLTFGLTAPILAGSVGLMKLAADAETVEMQFKTMLGEARGMAVLGDLRQFAATTPFQFGETAAAAKTLIAFGVEQEKLMGTMRMVGDVAAGTGKDYRELAVIFGQIRGMGRLQGQDFLQLVNAGFPVAEIAKTMGVSMETLKDEMEKGNVSFEIVEETFRRLTTEGGMFNGMMEKLSKTTGGRFSSMMDNLIMLGQKLGAILLPYANAAIEWLLVAADYFGNLSPEIQTVAMWVAAAAAAIGPLITMLGTLIGGVGGVTTIIGFFVTVGWEIALIAVALVGYLAALAAVWAAVGSAIAGAVYYVVGPEGIQSAFMSVLTTARTWAMGIIGFVWNIRHNIKALLEWFPRNWDGVLQDVLRLMFVFVGNMANNLLVVVRMGVRIFNLLKGYLAATFSQLFTRDFVYWAATGIMKVGEAFGKFAVWAAAKMAAALTGHTGPSTGLLETMLGYKDIKRGLKSKDIMGDIASVIREEAAGLSGPFEGFESSLREMPDLAFGFGIEAGAALTEGVQKGSKLLGRGGMGPQDPVAKQLQKDVDELTASLEGQVAAFGKSGTALEIWKLQQRGATEEQLKAVEAASRQLAVLQADEVVRGLERQVLMFGQAGHAAELYELRMAGATDAQMRDAEALYGKLDALKEEQDLMEEGRRLVEQHRSPLEKFTAEQEKLDKMLAANAIDLGTYNEALEDAREEMNKGATLKFKTEGLESLEAGSAAAIRTMLAFRRNAEGGIALPGAAGRGGVPAGGVRPAAGVVVDRRATGADRAAVATRGNTPHQNRVETLLNEIAETNRTIAANNAEPAAL